MTPLKFRIWQPHKAKMLQWIEVKTFWNLEDFDRVSRGDSEAVIMQSTGIRDMNDELIYEGDVIRRGNWIAKIEWGEFSTHYDSTTGWVCHEEGNHEYGLTKDRSEDIEIIGNIYQNPELLNLITT